MGEEEDEAKWKMVEQEGVEEEDEDTDIGGRNIRNWEKKTLQGRRTQELRGTGGRGVLKSPSRKRMGEQEDPAEDTPGSSTRKRWKYPLLTNWGEEEENPPPPLSITRILSSIPTATTTTLVHTTIAPTLSTTTIPPSPGPSCTIEDDQNCKEDDQED